MCQSLRARVPEYLAAVRDALHGGDAPRLREVTHKFCGLLSAFSTAAGTLLQSSQEVLIQKIARISEREGALP